MEKPIGGQIGADARDYLAEERTFLAWIRTGLALMGFGFVVARFGLFLAEVQFSRNGAAAPPNRPSLWFGTVFVAVGVAVNLLSIRRHLRVIADLNHGQFADRHPSRQGIVVALLMALLGVAMAVRLVLYG
jgi:putative membrane protein